MADVAGIAVSAAAVKEKITCENNEEKGVKPEKDNGDEKEQCSVLSNKEGYSVSRVDVDSVDSQLSMTIAPEKDNKPENLSSPLLHPLPTVPDQFLTRKFEVALPNIEVTSLDMTPHGCFVLAGCSNGMVLLFDMTSSSKDGTLVGHIRAKGMHTNLILTVKITEDSRYGFAGCLKGSMEMLAVDMGQIPMWQSGDNFGDSNTSGKGRLQRGSSHAPARVRTFNNLDPKLRGFGAVSRLKPQSVEDDQSGKYVLICGKGIKSVHVWLFTPNGNDDKSEGPIWNFLFDVATNGVTIEALGFRFCHHSSSNGTNEEESSVMTKKEPMLQMLSKSRGMCVRVWNLENLDSYENSEKGADDFGKLSYEDIPNSQDCKAFSDDGELAFGGTYDFSVLRLDAPKWANRESHEVPARCTEDDAGQRRRRMMREIDEIISCHDGNHVLALCTDGGVLYYRYEEYNNSGGDCNGGFGTFTEFQTLTREVEIGPEFMTDDCWAIKRVGNSGTVVIIRACKGLASKDEEAVGAIIDVSLLCDLAPEACSASSFEGYVDKNRGLYYHDDTYCKPVHKPVPDTTSAPGKPPTGRTRKRRKEKNPENSASDTGAKTQSSTPREKKKKRSENTPTKFSTPSETSRGLKPGIGSTGKRNRVLNISPKDNVQSLQDHHSDRSEKDVTAIAKQLYPPTPTKEVIHDDSNKTQSQDTDSNSDRSVLEGRKEHRSRGKRLQAPMQQPERPIAALPVEIVHPGPPPKVRRVPIASPSSSSASPEPVSGLLQKFRAAKAQTWASLSTSSFVAGIHLCDSSFLTLFGPYCRQAAEVLLAEQDRMYRLFLVELLRGLESLIAQVESATDALSKCKVFLCTLGNRFREYVTDMMRTQRIHIRSAMRKDLLLNEPTGSSIHQVVGVYESDLTCDNDHDRAFKPWSFVHCNMYNVAKGIVDGISKMVEDT